MERTRVLVIDDSALMRRLLVELLGRDPSIEVIGGAQDAFDARERIKRLNPDVLTLDIEMPRMNGLQFLKNLMRLHPLPVVMISSLTQKGAEPTLRALELGAVDFVSKPRLNSDSAMEVFAQQIVEKVRAAAQANLQELAMDGAPVAGSSEAFIPDPGLARRIVAIGASTGGTTAIRTLLQRKRPGSPPIVIAQHIPPVFSRSFAERLDRHSALAVVEADDGQEILPDHVYIAPGGYHLEVRRNAKRGFCVLHEEAEVQGHRPSVDVLFESVARAYGADATGVLLTGMGRDGAAGLLSLRERGARTWAQDKATSQIWGMPGAAVELGAATDVLSLRQIGERLNENCVTKDQATPADKESCSGRVRAPAGGREPDTLQIARQVK